MVLHNEFVFPFGQLVPYLVAEFIFNIAVNLICGSGDNLNIAFGILFDFLFNEFNGCLLGSAAAVADTVEKVGPFKTVFGVFFEFFINEIPVAQFC